MQTFTIYAPETGLVTRSGTVLAETDAALQAQPGEAILEGVQGFTGKHKVVNGALVALPVLPVTPQAIPPDTMAVVIALLKAKGIIVTAADLAAAHAAAATQSFYAKNHTVN